MVQFNCTLCRNKLEMSDDHIGKIVSCTQCGQKNTVPDPYYHYRYTEHSPSTDAPTKFKRKWIIFGLLALLLGGFLLYVFVQRDTWENDNFSTVMQMQSEAAILAVNGDAKQALVMYEDIFHLVGQRQIMGTTFKTVIDETHSSYNDLQNEYEKELCTSYISIVEEADRLVNSGNLSEGIKKYKEILRYKRIRPPQNEQLIILLRNASDGLARATKLTRVAQREERSRRRQEASQVRELESLAHTLAVIHSSHIGTYTVDDVTKARFEYLLVALDRKTIQSRQQIADISVYTANTLREKYGLNVILLDFMEGMNEAFSVPNIVETDYAVVAAAYIVLCTH